jgi:hypothetical protein
VDVLINMLLGFSRDFCGLKRVYVGGVNKSWPLDKDEDMEDEEVGAVVVDATPSLWPRYLDKAMDEAGGTWDAGQGHLWLLF